ncbi:MAG: phosphohydrolase [Trueperaceae bacterium]|nr:phosphohydrolase [Trueperaceae bacterium]
MSGVPRVLAVSDAVSPVVYSNNFPGNLAPFDLVLSAGDLPGVVLEFVATKTRVAPLYVFGNHAVGYVRDPVTDEPRPPGGCVNVHLKVVEVAGLLVVGMEGCLRYREGPHQYSQAAYRWMVVRLAPRLWWNRLRRGRAVDVLLTHAAPRGPHEGADHVHRGVAAFNLFHRLFRPRLHVHGHVHLSGANAPRSYVTAEGVRVVNAYEFTLVDL